MPFNAKTGEFYREKIEFPFFEYYLKGKGDAEAARGLGVRDRTNQWRKYDAWPPKDAKPQVALPPRRAASSAVRAADATDGGRRFDEYVSDPAKPVPFIDKIAHRHGRRVHDRRPAVRRRAGPTCWSTRRRSLEEDLTIAGPIEVELFVSTTGHRRRLGRQADRRLSRRLSRSRTRTRPACRWAAISNWSAATSIRGKFRNSFEKPEPFEPGEPTQVEVHACPTSATRFRPGHRIMVQVQSTLVPAGGPQPADVRATSTRRTRRTSRSKRTASTATRSIRRRLLLGW